MSSYPDHRYNDYRRNEYRHGQRVNGPSKVNIKCKRGDKCDWAGCEYLHPWNDNWPGSEPQRSKIINGNTQRERDGGWGSRRPNDPDQLNYGSADGRDAPPHLQRNTSAGQTRPWDWDDRDSRDDRESKRQRTDTWGSTSNANANTSSASGWDRPASSGSGSNWNSVPSGPRSGWGNAAPSSSAVGQHPPQPQPAHTRFGASQLDSNPPSSTNSPNPGSNSLQLVRSNDPRVRPNAPQRTISSNYSNPAQSPSTSLHGFQSPMISTVGSGQMQALVPHNYCPLTADPRASTIIVTEPGATTGVPLDHLRHPTEVLNFVMRRMSSAVRANVQREDLVAKHLVLKQVRETLNPLPSTNASDTNSRLEGQLNDSRIAIRQVDEKIGRYQMEVDVAWHQLAFTIGMGHLPSLAEVRDVQAVQMWIEGLKADMGRYLEDRMRLEVGRMETRVTQAAAAPRPRDDEVERQIGELQRALDNMRIEQAKQRRVDTVTVSQRLEAMEREMDERKKAEARTQAEIAELKDRMTTLEEVFGYTRRDLDTLVERVDPIEASVVAFGDVEKELRALIDSAVAQVPDPATLTATLTTTITERMTPVVVDLLEKHQKSYAQQLRGVRDDMDERFAQAGFAFDRNSTPGESPPS